jgi:hypothetical protein
VRRPYLKAELAIILFAILLDVKMLKDFEQNNSGKLG